MPYRIHIVGSSPRTGTTLMMELMLAGFRIDASADHEEQVYAPTPTGAGIHLSKAPQDILVAARVLDANPNLWILHMVRDPRDVIVSRHTKRQNRYWTTLRMWHEYRRAARRVEGHPRFLTIRYEDLVRDPDQIQKTIAEFMPFLEMRHPFSTFHRFAAPSSDGLDALGGVREVSDSSIGRWRDEIPRVKAQLEIHRSIDRDLVELGYEESGDWKRELDGVIAKNGKSNWKDHLSVWVRARAALERRRRVARYRRRIDRD